MPEMEPGGTLGKMDRKVPGSTGRTAPEVLSREERAHIFGIDCVESLVWRKWSAGEQYQRNITLRNRTPHTLKVKYKLPVTKFFTMDYPTPLKMAAGTSVTLPITFRPVEEGKGYDDYVEFQCNTGSFYVPVKAIKPYADLRSPDNLDFGFCTVKETTAHTFEIANTGMVEVNYRWKLDEPFTVEPVSGTLAPGQVQPVTARFAPEEASVFVGNAVVADVDGSEMARMQVTAIAKFPFVKFDQQEMDFGPVLVGKAVDQVTTLHNQSIVPATFSLARLEEEHDNTFMLKPTDGTIPPGGSVEIRVCYTPLATGTSTCERFLVSTTGGNAATLTCKGEAIGPDVRLSAQHLNFGSVAKDTSTSRIVHIENQSNLVVGWQFLVDEGGSFRFDRTSGTCDPFSSVHVSVTFEPREAANFYKRVVCLVKDRPTPLLLDISGTAYVDKQRPPLLKQSHVDTFYWRVSQGGPAMLKEGELPEGQENVPTSYMAAMTAPERWRDVFEPDRYKPVAIDHTSLQFGACSHLRVSDYKQVTVHNHGDQKVTAFWVSPVDGTGVGAHDKPRSIFTVFPEQADIKPGGSAVFRVAFRPGRNQYYYAHRLECFAYIKTMRNFRLVSEANITPPWCLGVVASGHTFVAGDKSGMPKAAFSAKSAQFPATLPGRASYNMLALVNDADTPVRFDLPEELHGGPASECPFSAVPMAGVVPPHSFQLIALKFQPAAAGSFSETFNCVLNHDTNNSLDLRLSGVGSLPKLRMLPPTMYFKPTCVGATTTRAVSLQNSSKVPVHFCLEVPERLQPMVAVSPTAGTLQPYQATQLEWTFVPSQQKQYAGRVPCAYVAATDESGAPTKNLLPTAGIEGAERLMVSVLGEGTPGAIAIDVPSVDFGTVQAHTTATQEVTVRNLSSGNLYYAISTRVASASGAHADVDINPAEILDVAAPVGMYMARSVNKLKLTFKSPGRCRYVIEVAVHTSNSPLALDMLGAPVVASDGAAAAVAAPSLEVLAAGDYPILSFSDVSSENVGKQTLWKQIAVSAVNAQLAAVPTAAEEGIRADSVERSLPVIEMLGRLEPATVSFAASTYGSPITTIHVELTNAGVLPLEFNLALRTDQTVDLENWVDLGQPQTEVDAHEQYVVENKIMDIHPRKGALGAGEKCVVTFTYLHDYYGEHRLPVLLEVDPPAGIGATGGGKKMNLTLLGKTLEPEDALLEILEGEHWFRPVAIGEEHPPVQTYELRNISDAEITYIVDVTPVQALKNANHGFQVAECLNPQGIVPPRGKALLKWRWSPVEAIAYQMDVPITVVGADTYMVKMCCQGYHPRPEEEPPLAAFEARLPRNWPGFDPKPSDDLEVAIGKQLTLTTSSVDYGIVPALAISRRVVTLASHSNYAYTFKWDLTTAAALEGALKIEPAEGRIEPYGQLMFKVGYRAGAWAELFDCEVSCRFEPVPEPPEPPPEPPSEEILAADGRHYTSGPPPRAQRPRIPVAHQHTFSSMQKYPALDLETRQVTQFPTDFNMAASVVAETLALPVAATTLVLNVAADVLSPAEFQAKHGLVAYHRHFRVFPVRKPQRETIPPQLPPGDVKDFLSDLLLDVMQDSELRAACGLKGLPHEAPQFFTQLTPGERPPALRPPRDADEAMPVGWEETLLDVGVKPFAELLGSYAPVSEPEPVPEPEPSEESEEPEEPAGGKKGKVDLEAEAAAKAAKEKKAAAKAAAAEAAAVEAAAREAEKAAAAQARVEAKAAAKEQRKAEARAAAEAAAERRAAAAAERAEAAALDELHQKFADVPECMQLAELVLEGTLFNLLKENHQTGCIL